MRTIRQILHGCKKHHLRYIKPTPWGVDRYKNGMRSDWMCLNCFAVISLPIVIGGGRLARPPKNRN